MVFVVVMMVVVMVMMVQRRRMVTEALVMTRRKLVFVTAPVHVITRSRIIDRGWGVAVRVLFCCKHDRMLENNET